MVISGKVSATTVRRALHVNLFMIFRYIYDNIWKLIYKGDPTTFIRPWCVKIYGCLQLSHSVERTTGMGNDRPFCLPANLPGFILTYTSRTFLCMV